MKTKYLVPFAIAVWSALMAAQPASAQGTVFAYQGRLHEGTNPANGSYDMLFLVYDAPFAGTQLGPITTNLTAVSDGLFTATMDFGPGVFTGPERWLEIYLRTNGAGEFVRLSPRQQITSSPYAITAVNAATAASVSGTVAASQLTGTVADTRLSANVPRLDASQTFTGANTFNNAANAFAGTFSGSGAGLTALNASSLASGTVPDARLPANLARVNADQTLAGVNTFTKTVLASDVKVANGIQLVPSSLDTSPLRIVRAVVTNTGAIVSGGGFTVTKSAPGIYTLVFTPGFSDYPAVVVSSLSDSGSPVTASATIAVPSGVVTVETWVSGVHRDESFSIIAIGAR